MDTLEFESSFGIKFKITNIQDSLRKHYILNNINPLSDLEVVSYLKKRFGYTRVSHCNTPNEERPFLEMTLITDLAEQAYMLSRPNSTQDLTSKLT